MNQTDQPGLRKRLQLEARRISSQHEKLNFFTSALADSLLHQSPQQAIEVFQRFEDALTAHLDLEEQMFFPALQGLRPDMDADLLQLIREHERFREALQRLARSIEASDLEQSRSDFETLCGELARHEAREEEIMKTGSAAAPSAT